MFIKLQADRLRTVFQILLTGLLLALTDSVALAEMRIWHTQDGDRFEAEFLREKPGKVFLRGTDSQNFTVALTNLVANDIKYIRSRILPEVQIDFSKSIEELERSDYARQTDHAMEVTGTVTVRRTSRSPFDGQFSGEVYLIAKEAATDDYRLFDKRGFAVRFPDGSREFEFETKAVVINYEEYTTEMRGAFYEGYVVILFDLQGNPMAFDSNLSWMDESRIDALRKLPVPSFFDQTCKKRSVPRPKSGYKGFEFSY
ncbi:MAG: hypothetical protein JEZ10_02020 [Verrucomicrobia bacterium]|nr:hypothetical protein [Verrucomicrobiota bacterium]